MRCFSQPIINVQLYILGLFSPFTLITCIGHGLIFTQAVFSKQVLNIFLYKITAPKTFPVCLLVALGFRLHIKCN